MNTTNKVLVGLGVLAAGVGGYFGYRNYLESGVTDKYETMRKQETDTYKIEELDNYYKKIKPILTQLSTSDLQKFNEILAINMEMQKNKPPYSTEQVVPNPNAGNGGKDVLVLTTPTENGKKNNDLEKKAGAIYESISEAGKTLLEK
jgi:hypothetical protein